MLETASLRIRHLPRPQQAQQRRAWLFEASPRSCPSQQRPKSLECALLVQRLPVNLSQHNIDASDRCDYIRNQPPLTHFRQGL